MPLGRLCQGPEGGHAGRRISTKELTVEGQSKKVTQGRRDERVPSNTHASRHLPTLSASERPWTQESGKQWGGKLRWRRGGIPINKGDQATPFHPTMITLPCRESQYKEDGGWKWAKPGRRTSSSSPKGGPSFATTTTTTTTLSTTDITR